MSRCSSRIRNRTLSFATYFEPAIPGSSLISNSFGQSFSSFSSPYNPNPLTPLIHSKKRNQEARPPAGLSLLTQSPYQTPDLKYLLRRLWVLKRGEGVP